MQTTPIEEAVGMIAALKMRVSELETQRDGALSLLGSLVVSLGGEVHIPKAALDVGYTFESETDPATLETTIRATEA